MKIYLLLFIPILTIAFLLIKYRRKLTWWEVAIHFGVATLLIILSKIITEKINITDTEYWGNIVNQVEYYEGWDEWITQICYRQVPCGTDSKGNTQYCSEPYDCSHSVYHPPYWRAIITNYKGQLEAISISKKLYQKIVNEFGNNHFVDLNRDYYSEDGDEYVSVWNGSFDTYHFIASEHTYDNKIQVAKSIFNFPEINEQQIKQYGLFEYPKVNDDCDLSTILGPKIKGFSTAERKLKYLNGMLGPKKMVRLWILLFKNKPLQSALMQEAFWKRGNKNELVVCIGIDNQENIKWNYVFSWVEKEKIKVDTRNFISNQSHLNLSDLSDFLYQEIDNNWVRKKFTDFDYLTVEPPLWAMIVATIIQLIFNIGFGLWSVKNEYE